MAVSLQLSDLRVGLFFPIKNIKKKVFPVFSDGCRHCCRRRGAAGRLANSDRLDHKYEKGSPTYSVNSFPPESWLRNWAK